MNFTKVVRLGFRPDVGNVFCKVTYVDGWLSITGVEGPMQSGDAQGSCGQIVGSYLENGGQAITEIQPATGWDTDKIREFFRLWDRWHLNNMRAGCKHQRQLDLDRKVEVVEYGLTHEARRMRDEAIMLAAKAAAEGKVANLGATAKALIQLDDWFKPRYAPPDADSPLSGCFEVRKREQKAIRWVFPKEHPDGMLRRPCPTCGYEYGTTWLREDVPETVLEWFLALPNADIKPAWV